jgi:hypothetical protein
MATTSIGSSGVTFPDATTQASGQQAAKAWVRFAGSTGGAIINSSYNISSITRNSIGDYTINFTNSLSDANYNAVGATTIDATSSNYMIVQTFAKTASPYYATPTTSAFEVTFVTSSGVYKDPYYASISVFR